MTLEKNELSKLLNSERILTYRQMKYGTPILADFKGLIQNNATNKLPLGGNYVTLRADENGTPRIQLRSFTYTDYILNPHIKTRVNQDVAIIRKTMDDYAKRTDSKMSFWVEKDEAFLKTTIPNVTSPFPFRNLANPDSDTKMDTSCDILIFTKNTNTGKLEILAIERSDLKNCTEEIGKQYALIGGMKARGGTNAGNISQMVLEILEEGISNSIENSTFYLDLIDNAVAAGQPSLPTDATKDTFDQETIRKLSATETRSSKELFLEQLTKLSLSAEDGDVSAKAEKAKYVLSILDIVDNYKNKIDSNYVTTRKAITQQVEKLTRNDSSQLELINHSDHRMTALAANLSEMNTLFLDTKIQELLAERDLEFKGGDDAETARHVPIAEFINNSWGEHGAFLVKIAALMESENLQLTPDQKSIQMEFISQVNEYTQSIEFAQKMNEYAGKLLNEVMNSHTISSEEKRIVMQIQMQTNFSNIRTLEHIIICKKILPGTQNILKVCLDETNKTSRDESLLLLEKMIQHCYNILHVKQLTDEIIFDTSPYKNEEDNIEIGNSSRFSFDDSVEEKVEINSNNNLHSITSNYWPSLDPIATKEKEKVEEKSVKINNNTHSAPNAPMYTARGHKMRF